MTTPARPRGWARRGPWVAAGGLACLLWLYGASVLVLPWWGVVLLVAAWLVLCAWAVAWGRTRPAASALIPVVGLVIWLGVVLVT